MKQEFAVEWWSGKVNGWIIVEQKLDTIGEAVRKVVDYQRLFPKEQYRVYEVSRDPKRCAGS